MGTVTRMELRKIDELHPYERNAKLHPPEQIEKLRRSFREFGMIVPVGIDSQDRVIYGHGRILAAQAGRARDPRPRAPNTLPAAAGASRRTP